MSGPTGSNAIAATVRAAKGKGASRQARLSGVVPAIIYGMKKEPVAVTLDPRALAKAVTGPLRRNAVITLNLKDAGGKDHGSRHVLVRELQVHPVRRVPTHVDFIEINPTQPTPMKVPVEVVGKSTAVADGAKLSLVVRTLNVLVVPNDMPVNVTYDVTGQGFGVVRAKQITLPKGMTLLDSPESPVVSVRMPRGDKEEAAAAAAPAEGAAAAPAADGKAAPAADAKAGAKPDAKADAKGDSKKK